MAKPEERDKAVRFISKLVQLTQDGKIKWSATTPPRNSDAAFEATVEQRSLKIYRYSEKITNPDYANYTSPSSIFGSSGFSISGRAAPPETITRAGVVLEVLDDVGRTSYKFENRTGLSDLYENASYSAAKIEDLMDAVLGKK